MVAVLFGLVVLPPVGTTFDHAGAKELHAKPDTVIATPEARVAQSNSCASACQAAHDQCRVQRKGSPSCDIERQRCLQACLASKRR